MTTLLVNHGQLLSWLLLSQNEPTFTVPIGWLQVRVYHRVKALQEDIKLCIFRCEHMSLSDVNWTLSQQNALPSQIYTDYL